MPLPSGDCILDIDDDVFAEMDLDEDVKNEDFLDNFNDFDMLLPGATDDDLLESRFPMDHPFFDSLLEDGITDFFDPISSQRDGDAFIKSEPVSPEDSPRSLSCSESSSSSSDGKYVLETPPVSPPVLDLVQLPGLTPADGQIYLQELPKKTVLKINPSNFKIVQNVKGLKPTGKRTKVILPKEVVKKVVNIKSKPTDPSHTVPVTSRTSIASITGVTSLTPVTSAPQAITLAKPVIIPSSQILPPNGIAICPSAKVKSSVQVTSRPVTSMTNPSKVLPVIKQEMDPAQKHDMKLKALKRQLRMIKNRESACLSRKKKKEYVTTLETAVSNLEQENARLRKENDLLKARVSDLESYCGDSVKPKPFLNTNLRKTTAVLAVLFMVSINIGSLGIISRDGRHSELTPSRPLTGSSSRFGRTLLWMPEGLDNSTKNSSQGPTCPLRINQTESLRLEKELRSWIAVDEKRVRYHNASKAYRPKKPSLRQVILHSNVPPSFKTHKIRASISAIDFYRPPFPGALPRRDDTFYVFSFSSDHLLVPAVAHNNTLRPRLSFVIPTIPLNDTVIKNGSVPMMQIDCEVLNTVSLQFTEKDFKLFKPQEEEAPKNQSADVKMGPPSFKPYFIQRNKFRPSPDYHDSFELNTNRVYRTPHNTFP